MLAERIEELKQKSLNCMWGKSTNLLLNLFDRERCNDIDERAKYDLVIRSQRDAMLNLLKSEEPLFSKKHEECFTLYNEVQVFDLLKKKDTTVQFVAKSRINGIATPDFSSDRDQKPINLELKTLSYRGSDTNFRRIQREMINTDPQKPEWLYQSSFGVDEIEMKSNTRRTVIEQLSTRIVNHYIERAVCQVNFNENSGMLIVDTVLLEQTLMMWVQDALPGYRLDCYQSGCLWNAVFAKTGDLIYQCTRPAANIKHNPIPSGGQRLSRNGVLIELQSLQALVFIIRTVHNDVSPKIIGFARHDLLDPVIDDYLNAICDFRNDEKNSNPQQIAVDLNLFQPLDERTITNQ